MSTVGEPFAGFADFAACKSHMMSKQGYDSDTADKVCGRLKADYETVIKDFEIKTIKEIVGDKDLKEIFKWVPDLTKIKQLNQEKTGVKFYAVKALHPMVTDPQNIGHGSRRWTQDEAMKSARTLVDKMLNLNHQIKITSGQNFVLDAEFADNEIQCIIAVEDTKIQEAITKGWITKVSVQGSSRSAEMVCTSGKCAETPAGTIFNALALVATKDFEYNGQKIPGEPPGDNSTWIKLIETNSRTDHITRLENYSLTVQEAQRKSRMDNAIAGVIQRIYEKKENLDSVKQAISGLADVPDEIKNQLLTLAAKLYNATEGQPPPPPGAAPPPATPPDYTKELATIKDGMVKLEKLIADQKEFTEKKMTDVLNNVIDTKIKELTKTAGTPPAPGTPTAGTLESLTDTQLGTAMEQKIREKPLSEILDMHSKGGFKLDG